MQSYTEIAETTSLTASRDLLLNNDKTVMSCHSGTAFPTTNLQVGMLCLRTDQMRLYQLRDTTPTWVFLADLNMVAPWGQFADLGVVDLNVVIEPGWYHQNANVNTTATGAANYPTPHAGLLRVFADGLMVYQFYSKFDTGEMFVRARYNGAWGSWRRQHDSVNLTNLSQLTNGPGFLAAPDLPNTPGGLAISIDNTDLNVRTKSGFYRGTTLANAPDAGYWFVTVESHGSGHHKQTITAYGVDAVRPTYPRGTTFVRICNNGTWEGWQSIGGGATGGASNKAFYENDKAITDSYTIGANKNAMTAGPITISDGVVVTIPDGSVWTVV